jgi:hypothetical protein
MVFLRRDDDEELEVPEDEEATLADDILDEVEEESTDLVGAEEIEGFGLIDEAAIKEEEEKEEGEGEEGDAPLEEDAEDVDFDTFDDIDEL